MSTRTAVIEVSLQRLPILRIEHPQANPLTLACTLRAGESLPSALTIKAEVHASRNVTAETVPLASSTVSVAADATTFEVSFTSAQLNQAVAPNSTRQLWLVVYGAGPSDTLYTLAGAELVLGWHAISQLTPPPPEVSMLIDVGGRGWRTGWQYEAETLVVNGTTPYVSLSAHTSSAATEPGVGSDWETVWQAAGGVANVDWGDIGGSLSSQVDLMEALDAKQDASALGTMSSQNSNSVAITGGTIGGITDLAVADGGTGASTAAGARVNLDVPSVGDLDAQRVDIQTFGGPSTSGSFTWVKPANAKLVLVRIIGAGSGGASGICRATSVLRTGGGGGAGGAAAIQLIPAADLPATVAVTVGAGTVGGVGTSNTAASHANAVQGGASFFGNYRANGGGVTNGTTAATGLSGSVFSLVAGAPAGNGGAGNTTGGAGANAAIQPSHFVGTGGGGGGSAAAGNTNGANGGDGGSRLATAAPLGYGVLLAGGTGGVSGGSGSFGGAGNDQDQSAAAGTGGGGGAYATGANGGTGGQGGWPGGGGGGGGAADDGFTAGSGGRGGHGMVQVITYF